MAAPRLQERSTMHLDRYLVLRAGRLHAKAHNTDPFAFDRIMHYMKMGYENYAEVAEDAESKLKARGADFAIDM